MLIQYSVQSYISYSVVNRHHTAVHNVSVINNKIQFLKVDNQQRVTAHMGPRIVPTVPIISSNFLLQMCPKLATD